MLPKYSWMCVLLLESGQIMKSCTLRENSLPLCQQVILSNSSKGGCGLCAQFLLPHVIWPGSCTGFFLTCIVTTVNLCVQLS